MTLIFNPDKYKKLLTSYLPKLIKTETENEKALAIVEDLMHRERTPEENEIYQLLITLIEKFEQENYNFTQRTSPQSLLLFLLEQSNKSKNDLQVFFGSESLVDEILEGKQNITSEQAEKLGEFFHVEPSLFKE